MRFHRDAAAALAFARIKFPLQGARYGRRSSAAFPVNCLGVRVEMSARLIRVRVPSLNICVLS